MQRCCPAKLYFFCVPLVVGRAQQLLSCAKHTPTHVEYYSCCRASIPMKCAHARLTPDWRPACVWRKPLQRPSRTAPAVFCCSCVVPLSAMFLLPSWCTSNDTRPISALAFPCCTQENENMRGAMGLLIFEETNHAASMILLCWTERIFTESATMWREKQGKTEVPEGGVIIPGR